MVSRRRMSLRVHGGYGDPAVWFGRWDRSPGPVSVAPNVPMPALNPSSFNLIRGLGVGCLNLPSSSSVRTRLAKNGWVAALFADPLRIKLAFPLSTSLSPLR